MKKTITTGIAALALAVVLISSCKKKSDAPSCEAMVNAISSASTAFSSDPSTENCTKLKNAYKDYLNSSCISDAQREETQQALDLIEAFCD